MANPVHTELTNNIVKKRLQPSGKKIHNVPGNTNDNKDTATTFNPTFLMNEVAENASTMQVRKTSRSSRQHNATDMATAYTHSGEKDALRQRYDSGKFISSIPPTAN